MKRALLMLVALTGCGDTGQPRVGYAADAVVTPVASLQVKLSLGGEKIVKWDWQDLMRAWSETSHAMQRLRDNPRSADEELEWRCDAADAGKATPARSVPNVSAVLRARADRRSEIWVDCMI